MTLSDLYNASVHVRLTDNKDATCIAVTKCLTGNRLRVTLKNTGTEPVKIREVALFADTLPLPEPVKFYGEGYHMLSQYRGTSDSIEVIGSYGDDKTFFNLPDNPYDKDLFILYYLMEFQYGDRYDLLAFTSCESFLGKFRFRHDYLEIIQDTENISLMPGCTWNLEELSLFSGTDGKTLYHQLASTINSNHPPMKFGSIPTGWCSYYCMGAMDPQGLYENAAAMASRIPELKMIQIDAGTATTDGDWLVPRFSEDLAEICRKVREHGVEAGGYFSPFIVNFSSDLYREHPDWLVKDESGNPTNRCSHNKNWCILDGSHPEARAYLRKIARYMHDECGLRYFKLDFLSYGALPAGKRYDNNMTSVQAYRLAMKAIVEEVGADSFILACNAPFWPTLGLCHGNRTTNDIFRDWKHVSKNALEQFYRNWQHQRLWINDPDCILLEKLDVKRRNGVKPCTLTESEFEFHKAFAIASGGMILSGDLLYQLSEENIAVLRTMIENMGESAVFDDDQFQIGRFREKRLLCLFNWESSVQTLSVPMEGKGTLTDLWTGVQVLSYEDTFEIELPPHGGMVLSY